MLKSCLLLSFFALGASLPAVGQIAEKPEDVAPLLIGESMPNVRVIGLSGEAVSILDIVKEKPTVLVFYRGGWCPYCNRQLSALGQEEAAILELGYQIVAISPDKVEKLRESVAKSSLNYRLYSDADGALSQAAGLAFKSPERYDKMLSDWSGGQNPGFLPVPAVFVLNTDGQILFEYINPDYKQRLSNKLLMAVLGALAE